MAERLAFTYGTRSSASGVGPPGSQEPSSWRPRSDGPPRNPHPPSATPAATRETRDWAFIGLMVFTGLLFFRPQDLITPLRALHLAELAALFALGALAMGRLGRGLTITRITPELIGVVGLGVVILGTAPFSIWPGGAIGTFTELYMKVVLIFILMVNTLTSPKRIEQFIWLIVAATGYIAFRAVFDYARGVNLIENGRVQGAVGGIFKNPNDLALNMIAVLPLAGLLAMRPLAPMKRAAAALCGVLMVGAIVATHSRSGTVGLAVMLAVFAVFVVRRRPGLVFAGVLAGALALPLLPASYWARVASITNEELDQTGSREARSILMRESYAAFAANPLTGVGAGQFKNYDPEGRQEAWRESHNIVLQVAAELGVFGLIAFGFLVARALSAPFQTRRLLRRLAPGRTQARGAIGRPLPPAEHEMLTMHAAALTASLAGWLVCALFASVAYHWMFYYLLALAAAPRDYLTARLIAGRAPQRAGAAAPVAAMGVHA
jgi:putative inorganic carbon (hco3(-)) transporter